jgi:hypothetical protein
MATPWGADGAAIRRQEWRIMKRQDEGTAGPNNKRQGDPLSDTFDTETIIDGAANCDFRYRLRVGSATGGI